MDNQNRLLAMLNAATSPPPSSNTPPTSSIISPIKSSGSAAPNVTLQSLFRGLTSPPLEPTSHQEKMWGMFNPAPGSGSGSGITGTPPNGSVRPLFENGERQKENLLNMFNGQSGTSTTPLPEGQPVITHSTAAPSPPIASPPPPQNLKSMFDFVSPFDAFEKPKAKPTPPPAKKSTPAPAERSTPTTNPREDGKAAPPLSAKKEAVSATPPPPQNRDVKPTPEELKRATSSKPKQVEQLKSRQASISSTSSAPGPASGKKGDLVLVWQVGKVVGKDIAGEGPSMVTSSRTVIDFSQPNLDSLVGKGAQVVPTTILKLNENVRYHKGRSVGITKNWVAYTLSKGKIRLIDSASGARLVLQLPPTASNGPVVDIAVTNTAIAAIGADHSVTVFSVPSSWDSDDPSCETIVHISPSEKRQSPQETLGEVFKVEWQNDGGRLAVGGTEGVVIISPADEAEQSPSAGVPGFERRTSMDVIGRANKVLKTDGTLTSFCFNYPRMAIALLSSTSVLSLFSVDTLKRAWHRQLPTSDPTSIPSSVNFCEANILVGRDNNTLYDLVQITKDLALFSSIRFTSPSPSPSELNFTQPVYDAKKEILWIGAFSRGSLYGFRYVLKGLPPIEGAPEGSVRAFDAMVEYPLEPVLSMVLAEGTADGDTELFFAHPTGFSQGQIDKASVRRLREFISETPREMSPTPDPVPTDATPTVLPPAAPASAKKVRGAAGKQSKAASPLAAKLDLPPVDQPDEPAPVEGKEFSGVSAEEFRTTLEKTEDRMTNHFKQVLTNNLSQINSRLDVQASTDFSAEISKQIADALKQNLPSIQKEVRSSVNTQVPTAIQSAMKTIPDEIARNLAPVIQNVVSSAIENAVREEEDRSVLPALQRIGLRLEEQVVIEMQRGLAQIREEVSASQLASSTDSKLESLFATMNALQVQFSTLAQPPALAAPTVFTGPSPSAAPPIPAHPQLPTAAQLEDVFLPALGAQSTDAVIRLVLNHWTLSEYLFPQQGAGPLSQAVLITLLHRLSLSLGEVPPADPMFASMVVWERRAAMAVNPVDPSIQSYWPKVAAVVQGALANVVSLLSTRYSGHQDAIRQVMGIVASKLE